MNTPSSIFMVVVATVLFLGSSPLLISPMAWARRVGWKVPEETDLANYLGRSLAGLILPVSISMYLAARDPWEYRIVFDLLILAFTFASIIHFYGFLMKVQPLIEHVEILIYSGLALGTWYFYPKPPV